jgi:RecB family endonuclease NucS
MESKIQKAIILFLESIGYYVIKTVRTNKVGVPDIIACCPKGKFYAIEVKAKGKKSKVTKLQQYHIDLINKTGGKAFVADSIKDVEMEILSNVEDED